MQNEERHDGSVRIASLSPAATEILFALGLGGRIVCTDQFSNHPDEAKAIPHVRDHQNVKAETLIEYKPEIVLTGISIQQNLAVDLRQAGFTVVHQDPRTINAVYESIRQFGTIFDVEEKAHTLVLQMQQGLNAVKKKASLLGSKPRVYVEEWLEPPMISGNWVPEVVRIAGGEPFPIPPGELSRAVTLEEVARFNPDLIVISWCGAGSLVDKKLLMGRPGWDALRAVQTGHVKVIDDSLLNRPGPRLVEGAQRLYGWMFEMLH
ncbi:MAG: iron complex transport system substrate-binding protein [Candidatus Peregrinibacteria bacterium Greene0416_19]|nr:MAG: iron complex transport system substrate-binding protein [Candidatus Peregrinibacteria bacterium Greene0416_19]